MKTTFYSSLHVQRVCYKWKSSLIGTSQGIPPAWWPTLSFSICLFPSRDSLWCAVWLHKTKAKSWKSRTVFVCTILRKGQAESTHHMEHQLAHCRCSTAQFSETGCRVVHNSMETRLSPKHLAPGGIILALTLLFRVVETEIWINFAVRKLCSALKSTAKRSRWSKGNKSSFFFTVTVIPYLRFKGYLLKKVQSTSIP